MSDRKYVLGYVMVGEPDLDVTSECGECGFDSVITFPLKFISPNGVGDFGVYKVCGRCYGDDE